MIENLLKLKHSKITFKINKTLIPITALSTTQADIDTFNTIYFWLKDSGYNEIIRTKSGGISKKRKNLIIPSWDVSATKTCVELTILLAEGAWRIQVRTEGTQKENDQIYGSQAFTKFREILKKYNININDYARENGAETKQEIERYIIGFENPQKRQQYKDLAIEGVHHIDFHNSFPAGLVNTHNEFYAPINYLYENRKTDPINKAILNLSIGYMQSISCCQARWAHLSKDAIADNNKRVRELAQKVKDSGCDIVLYNTDGFWYKGPVYHGENEGNKLGQWENDHINCKFRAKSDGAYEYTEDGKYHPVIRGRTKLDEIKSREYWEWGDIYKKIAAPIIFQFSLEQGIIRKEEEGDIKNVKLETLLRLCEKI